jgi:SagB-type dehydrogenase family enzyme
MRIAGAAVKVAIAVTVWGGSVASPGAGACLADECSPGANAAAIQLPQPRLTSGTSVERAILERRSVRKFLDLPITLADLGQLLWAAQGVTSAKGLRAAPSAGALYPLETYVAAGKVTGLPAGIYRYLPKQHALVQVRPGDHRIALSVASLNEYRIREAPACLVFAADFARTTLKYGERGRQYVFMDEGHAGENVYLQAVALNLGTFMIGGLNHAAVAKTVCLPATQQPISVMPLGRPRQGAK